MWKQRFEPKNLTNPIKLRDERKLYLIEHSLKAIRERKISEKDIEEVFINPDIIMPNKIYGNARNYVSAHKI